VLDYSLPISVVVDPDT